MKITSSWVGYIDRTFRDIRSSILTNLQSVVPELKDRSQSNLLIILIDIFSAVGELLNYYIDSTARELFITTVRRFESILKLASLVSYTGKAAIAAYAIVEITALDGNGDPIAIDSDLIIPSETKFTDNNGEPWLSLQPITLRKGYSQAQLQLRQVSVIQNYDLGKTQAINNFVIPLPEDYCYGSLDLTVGGNPWNRVEDLGFSFPESEDFQVVMKSDGDLYVEFGDGVNGLVPADGSEVLINYWSTMGKSGNVSPDYIKTLDSALGVPSPAVSWLISNPVSGYGGKDKEGLEDLRKAIPLSLKTLYRAVSKGDYVALANLAPGVRGSLLEFDCGMGVTLYIVAEGGGTPSQSLLDDVENFIKPRAVLGFPITLKPSGETHIRGSVTIKGRYRTGSSTIKQVVDQALLNLYNPYETSLDTAVRSSDIIACIDNLPEVDYLILTYFYAIPYLRPSNLSVNLDYTINILPTSSRLIDWKLVYSSTSGQFILYRSGVYIKALDVGTQYSIEGIMEIQILSVPSNLVDGDSWVFKTYPYNKDIELNDHSIPIIGPGDFTYQIEETNG